MEKLDMTRYEIPSPAPNTPQAIDKAAWIQVCSVIDFINFSFSLFKTARHN
jgi:hypothetical protein